MNKTYMAKSTSKFKRGQKVTTFLRRPSGEKIAVTGVIKDLLSKELGFGHITYVLSDCTVSDFSTRMVKKMK